jgi:hypothetical protein
MILRGLCALAVAGLILGQDTPQRLTFEVAKIKPTPTGGRRGGIGVSPGGQTYIAQGSPVKLMISLMYKIPIRQITGGPDYRR